MCCCGWRPRRELCVSSEYPGGQSPRYRQSGSRGSQHDADWEQGVSGPPLARQQPGDYDYSQRGAHAPTYPTSSAPGRQGASSASQRPGWLVPVIVAALVIVVLGAVAGIVYAVGRNALQEPMNTANAFCDDMKTQNYGSAYNLLSSGYKAHMTSQQFTEASQIHDQLDGKVKQCGLAALQSNGGFTLNLNPENASFNAQMTRNRDYTGAVTLVKQNGVWKIDALDDALQGADIGALATGEQFCKALSSQDYTAVYGMFTPAYQQQIGSVDQYVNGLKQVFGDGQYQITGCQPQLTTFTVTAQDDAASVSGAFNIKVTTDAGTLTVPVPYKMAFAKISGNWKISDLEVVQSQG